MSFIGSLYRPSLPPFNPRRAAPWTALEHLHRLRAASRILALVRVVFALVVVLSVALVFALVVVSRPQVLQIRVFIEPTRSYLLNGVGGWRSRA